jgi:ligand-binding sensor domain-containing protein
MAYKMSDYTNLALPGPASNKVVNITSSSGYTIVCGGGTDNSWNSLKRSFMVSVYENNQFTNFTSGTATDAMRSCFDPVNSSHFFISTWGNGLLEYNNNTLVKQYDNTNSPLQADGSLIKVCGLAMDGAKNLWITQTGVTGSIKILRSDGTWIVHPAVIDAPLKGDIISTRTGQKWIVLPGGYGIFIVDDSDTPDQTGDDKSKKLTVTDADGNTFNSVFSIAEDLDGNIWLGTDHGPVVYYTPERIFEEDTRGYRIKVPRNDGSGLADYLLGTETITTISVDGANRKWLGTMNSGAYLISADGTKMLRNFNKKNSPLFSDSLTAITVENKTGEVWFGTSEGVLSVRETATSGSEEFNKVYSFPNPVRENYNGNVTITGLIRDTQVKITDISGNLVFEIVSEGGQATWDLTTYNGRRVITGVYLVFCSNNDGSRSCVTKILVIGR